MTLETLREYWHDHSTPTGKVQTFSENKSIDLREWKDQESHETFKAMFNDFIASAMAENDSDRVYNVIMREAVNKYNLHAATDITFLKAWSDLVEGIKANLTR